MNVFIDIFSNIVDAISRFGNSPGLKTGSSPFFRRKRGTVRVWDGHNYIWLDRKVLEEDGFAFSDKVVHHRLRRRGDISRENLVVITHEEHKLIHLVEDRYNVETHEVERADDAQKEDYKNLPEHIKKPRIKKGHW